MGGAVSASVTITLDAEAAIYLSLIVNSMDESNAGDDAGTALRCLRHALRDLNDEQYDLWRELGMPNYRIEEYRVATRGERE
jgi:hypothetical protein